MPYTVGIDETGSFRHWDKRDTSFAAATVTTASDKDLYNVALDIYNRHLAATFGNNPTQRAILENFSYKKLFPRFGADGEGQDADPPREISEAAIKEYIEKTAPFIKFVVRSEGAPLLLTNQQHWWAVALRTVLDGTMKRCAQEPASPPGVNFFLDSRAKRVTGLYFEPDTPEAEIQRVVANYHSTLAKHFETFLQSYSATAGPGKVMFSQDTDCWHIQLADIVCGVLRNRPQWLEDAGVAVYTVRCLQESHANIIHELVNRQDYADAARLIIEEAVLNDELVDAKLLLRCLTKVREVDIQDAQRLWTSILDFAERGLESRGTSPKLPYAILNVLKNLSAAAAGNWGNEQAEHARQEIALRLGRIHITGLTHVGDIDEGPAKGHDKQLEDLATVLPTPGQRWEALVEAKAAHAQILFNDYRFEPVLDMMLPLLDQPTFPNVLPGGPDDLMAKVLGTIGQAFAFEENFSAAEEELRKDLNITSHRWKGMARSFLISLFFRQKQLQKALPFLEQMTGRPLEEYANNTALLKSVDNWLLGDILRLLALRCENGDVCMAIDMGDIDRKETDYPYPLALKWGAFVNAKAGETDAARAMLRRGIDALSRRDKFTTRTLAVPHYLMLGLLETSGDGKERLQQEYLSYIEPLLVMGAGFKAYIEKKDIKPALISASEDAMSLWDRATALPFYYS